MGPARPTWTQLSLVSHSPAAFLWRSLQTPWEVSVDVTADSNTDESQAAVRRDSPDTTNMWEELTDTYHQEKGALMF